jgi:hypothetical protein
MSDLFDSVLNTFPANNDQGVPLRSTISVTLSGTDYSDASLQEGFFVEGPDTDQFIGPGQLDLVYPDNISQGDLNDFLNSPGYKGIVPGDVTVSGIAGNTVVTFTSEKPLAPLTEYIVNLTDITDLSDIDIDGFVSFSFETGSGSIETIPSTVSTSILSATIPETIEIVEQALSVISSTPVDRTVEHSKDLREIYIDFNKDLDPTSVSALASSISVKALSVSDHPSLTTKAAGELAKVVEVEGNRLKIII